MSFVYKWLKDTVKGKIQLRKINKKIFLLDEVDSVDFKIIMNTFSISNTLFTNISLHRLWKYSLHYRHFLYELPIHLNSAPYPTICEISFHSVL